MQELRILVARHYGLKAKHGTSIILDNLLPILNTRFKVKIIWFFFMPERVNFSSISQPNFEMVDIHDFNNAVEVMKKIKPSLVFDNEFPSLMDLSLDIAAKYLNIPVASIVPSADPERNTKFQFFTSFLPTFFHSSMPFEERPKKQFMRRGRFFLYKYWFLFKTLKAARMCIFKIIEYLFRTLKWHISITTPFIDSRFANTLQFLESESLVDIMIKKGFSRSSLVVTGNPIYDGAFKKYKNYKPVPRKNNKTRILFVPMQLYEGGIWTKKQRDHTIKQVIKNISENKNKFSLIVKLHPSSQSYEEYKSLIHDIDPTIPIYQKGMIVDYLDDVDLVMSFGTIYSSLLFPLIAHKPLVICNFFDFKPITPINKDVVWECTKSSELAKIVNQAFSSQSTKMGKIDNYLKKIMYRTDGRASERLCEAITNLIKEK